MQLLKKCSLLTKNTEPPPQPEGRGFLNKLFLAMRIPEKGNKLFIFRVILNKMMVLRFMMYRCCS